jgi:hypothetical protein
MGLSSTPTGYLQYHPFDNIGAVTNWLGHGGSIYVSGAAPITLVPNMADGMWIGTVRVEGIEDGRMTAHNDSYSLPTEDITADLIGKPYVIPNTPCSRDALAEACKRGVDWMPEPFRLCLLAPRGQTAGYVVNLREDGWEPEFLTDPVRVCEIIGHTPETMEEATAVANYVTCMSALDDGFGPDQLLEFCEQTGADEGHDIAIKALGLPVPDREAEER